MVVMFAKWLFRMYQAQGIRGVVLHLKACHVLLMQGIAGYRVEDISDLNRRVKRTRGSGLPRLIPAQARVRIRAGDRPSIIM